MALAAGARLGSYVIEAPLHGGAMGQVYRATDTRLNRRVAVKILPPELASRARSRARFAREARALSGLSHPHICPVYDVGEDCGLPFLVMEYLEGETLAQRLVRGSLPVAEAVRLAIEMADALQYAHRKGVVHRDLKPANVMLTHAGVKLLDFGLARLDVPIRIAGSPDAPAHAPTDVLTEEDAIVGTIQYMAPEQLEGMETDGRSDIFALGATLYEMVTGRTAFSADSRAGVIAAVLERTPPRMAGVRGTDAGDTVPPLLEQIVARCMAKRREDRWQTASDLREALTWITSGAAPGAPRGASATGRVLRLPPTRWVLLGVLLLVALAAGASHLLRGSPAPVDRWFEIAAPDGGSFDPASAFLAASPDGNHLAFVAAGEGSAGALWVRARDVVAPRRLPDTEGAYQPFWSADSRFIAFGTGRELRAVEISTNVIRTLSDIIVTGGSWSQHGVILVALGPNERRLDPRALYRISSAGGPPLVATTLDAQRAETSHVWPQFLPDGRRFLYLVRSMEPEHDGTVMVGFLDSGHRVALFQSDSHAVYVAGYVLFMRGNRLLAQPFDVKALRTAGQAVTIAEGVERNPLSRRGAFTVSENGVLAYRALGRTEMVWLDRRGGMLGSTGGPGLYSNPSLSPDEQRLAVERADPKTGESDVWIFELRTGRAFRFTHTGGERPLWSPFADRIVFRAPQSEVRERGPDRALISRATTGDAADEVLMSGLSPFDSPLSWSPDGSALIYTNRDSRSGPTLWMLPLSGNRASVRLTRSAVAELHGQVSPDGAWLAFVSYESGTHQVYVRPLPSGEDTWPISHSGGIEPVWRRDAKELFYLAADRSLMSVRVSTAGRFDASDPSPLFQTRLSTVMNAAYTRNQYVVSADGQRFLVVQPSGLPPPVTVVIDWLARLRVSR